MAPVLERAPSGSERNGSDAGDARAPHKRNRSGAQKRRAKRDKEKAPEGQAPGLTTALTTLVEGATGLTVWVPGPPRPAAAVLALLERQKPGIGALNWRVFAENVGASPEGRNYVFGILESSVLKLRGRDSKLCYGIEQITVKVTRSHEPWVVRGCVRGVAACGKLFKAPTEQRPRACITVKGLDARLLPEVCFRDLTAVEVTAVSSAGDASKFVICSAYFPHGEEVPSLEIVRLVDLCQREGLPLLIGCDANAHHTIWGSTGTNERGRRLLEYLVTTDLEVLNRDLKVEVKKVRNPKRTDWISYQRDLGINLRDFPKKYGTAEELELCVDYLQRALIGSYEANCPASTVTNNRETPWWNPRLQDLRVKARRAWNKARNTGRSSDWDLYKRSQKEYRDSVAKRKSWRNFCESVEGKPATTRLCRFLSKNPEAALEAVRMSDGTMVSGEKCLVHLLETSFPGFRRDADRCGEADMGPFRARASDWKLAAEIVRPTRVRWVIGSFRPFTSAGPNQMFLALLQRGLEQVIGPLTKVLRACLALGYTP
ncbi:PREDICTED: uncharacterized protein LOC108762980 [Trachymyrmex cornetzi]|uniref:uncharacterized protein LOC108762980 n=1 Tax=Trachymyrmex cornetzi TaxID=471704 RepID=UPI00084F6CD7|nr:PREDICTED: uncharacterized protein LOC108762980 [Trachymyrmex cornetzi]